jgi:hypothetical protein
MSIEQTFYVNTGDSSTDARNLERLRELRTRYRALLETGGFCLEDNVKLHTNILELDAVIEQAELQINGEPSVDLFCGARFKVSALGVTRPSFRVTDVRRGVIVKDFGRLSEANACAAGMEREHAEPTRSSSITIAALILAFIILMFFVYAVWRWM